MDIDDLKKQLYKNDGQLENRPKPPEEFNLDREIIEAPSIEKPQWQDEEIKPFVMTVKQKRKIIFGLAAVVLVATLLGGGFYWWQKNSFNTREVALDIFGSERVISGEEISYVVRIKNNTKSVLEEAKLEFIFPGTAVLSGGESAAKQGDLNVLTKNIDKVSAGQEVQEVFKVRVLGDKDSEQKFIAKLNYKPANSSMSFSSEQEFFSKIISVPLVLGFILPEKIVSGQVLNFSLKYVNTSDATFGNSQLKIEYPEGFVFDSAFPSPSEGKNLWTLPEIGSGEEGKIVIKGSISGNEGESKVFKAQLGMIQNEEFVAFAQTMSSPQISVSPLFVEQEVVNAPSGRADLGTVLNYRLKYRNTTSETIGPVIISLKIDSRAVDAGSVVVPKGSFSSSESTILWNASSLPGLENLAPGSGGEVTFSLKVKDRLPITNSGDKNFSINTLAQIDSPNIPLSLTGTSLTGKDQTTVKINSRVILTTKGFYVDKVFPNTGPLPPRVGQKTTYTIYWQLINVSNDVSESQVEAYLPSYISFEGKTYPNGEDITYNQATGKVVWKIGRLPAGTGVGLLLPVKQVAFQIGLNPSLTQVGSTVAVVKEAQFKGEDGFTGNELLVSSSELKSDMPDDQTVGAENGRVGN